MKNYRLSKGTTEHYTSLEELRTAWGKGPVPKKRTKDPAKLEKQRANFTKNHLCEACKKPLEVIEDTNVMVCTNPDCLGIQKEREDKDGNKIVSYHPSFNVLTQKSMDIMTNIFD